MADLPDAATCYELLARMALIRRFEEEAGRQYQRAKAGGFLHLAIGEEATIVGTTSVMRDEDYLIGTYRTHGHAIARGTDPKRVMAELFGRVDGTSGGRGGSMHIFDAERRFMGGYGIVGGNLPIAAGLALSSDYKGEDAVTVCMFGDGASNTGNFGETMNLAALWKLPVLFLVENNLYGMGTSVERHSAQTDLSKKAEGYGIPGERIDGMDVIAVREARRRGDPAGPRGAPADPARGLHLPLPRPLRRRPRGLPRARGGRGVAREGPDRDASPGAASRPGCWASARCRRCATRPRQHGRWRRSSSPRPRPSRRSTPSTRTSTCSTEHERLVRGRRAQPRAAPRRARGARCPTRARELAEAGAAYAGQPDGPRPNPADARRRPGGVEPRGRGEVEDARRRGRGGED